MSAPARAGDPRDLTGTGLDPAWVDELVERTLVEFIREGAEERHAAE